MSTRRTITNDFRPRLDRDAVKTPRRPVHHMEKDPRRSDHGPRLYRALLKYFSSSLSVPRMKIVLPSTIVFS
jgi:hypothetical protein